MQTSMFLIVKCSSTLFFIAIVKKQSFMLFFSFVRNEKMNVLNIIAFILMKMVSIYRFESIYSMRFHTMFRYIVYVFVEMKQCDVRWVSSDTVQNCQCQQFITFFANKNKLICDRKWLKWDFCFGWFAWRLV